MKRLRSIHRVLSGAFLLAVAAPSTADTHLWTGLGLNGHWSIPANWSGNNPPAAGEASPVVIVFPTGAARPNNTNNIAGLVVDRLTFDGNGYNIQGSGAGANLTFRGGVYNFGGSGSHTLGETLTITLSNTVPFATMPGANIRIKSKLVGAGGLRTFSTGVLTLNCSQDNTYTGTTTIHEGVLALAGGYQFFSTWVPSVSVSGPLVIGTTNLNYSPYVIVIYDEQIANTAPVTINANGYLYLGGNDESIGALTMTGGSLYGDSLETSLIGTLTLGGNVTAHYSPLLNGVITAHLNLGGLTRTVNVASNATFVMSGNIAPGGDGRFPVGITKTGAGTLILSAAGSTYDGTTAINAGVVEVTGNGALGATSGGTTVASGAQLILNSVAVGAEPLTLNGAGTNGALVGVGVASIGGQLTLASDTSIFVGTGSLLTFGGLITGPGGLTKLGGGTLRFSGAGDNAYEGLTQVPAGRLQLNQGTSLAVPAALRVGGGASSATVQFLATGQLSAARAVQIETNGLFELNHYSSYCGSLTLNHGYVTSSSGTLTVFGGITVPAGGDAAIHGKLSLGGSTRTINIGTNGGLGIYATLGNGGAPAGITKTGDGLLAMWNSNSFSGPVTINAGLMQIDRAAGLGTGAGGVVVNTGGTLALVSDPYFFTPNYVVSNVSLTLNGPGFAGLGALAGVSSNGWAGPISLATDSRVSGIYYGDYLELIGPVSGPGELEIGGGIGGAVILSGNTDNTFGGALRITGTNTVLLAKSSGATAIGSNLIIGTTNDADDSAIVRLRAHNQIANGATVAVFRSGLLDLNGYNDTLGPLEFTSGEVQGAPGVLTLGGNVTVNAHLFSASVYCPVSLGGQTRTFSGSGFLQINNSISDGGGSAGIVKTGPGTLQLASANTYSGPTTISDGTLGIYHGQSLGSAAQGTIVTNTGRLRLLGVSVSGEPLSLAGNGVNGVALSVFGTNVWTGPVTLSQAPSLHVNDPADRLTFSGVVSGPGSLTKDGSGTLAFTGPLPNQFDGTFFANEGTTELNKPAGISSLPGQIILGRQDGSSVEAVVRCWSHGQTAGGFLGSTVTVHENGLLDLNNYNESLGLVRLKNGAIVTGTGILTLNQNLYGEGDYDHVSGVISLGGVTQVISAEAGGTLVVDARIVDGGAPAGITVRGEGGVMLYGSNSFSGPLVVDQSFLWVLNDYALGKTNSGTFVTNNATLAMHDRRITGEPLTIQSPGGWNGAAAPLYVTGTNSWSGPVELPAETYFNLQNTDSVLTVSGPISGPGGLAAGGSGTLRLTGTAPNTFTGPLSAAASLVELAKTNAVSVYGPLNIYSGKVRYGAAHQLLDTSAVTIQTAGTLDLNGFSDFIGDLNGWGAINLGAGVFTVGGGNPVNGYAGNIAGAGGELDKIGGNTLVLLGTNSYTSATLVKGGTLIVNGVQETSDVYVQAGATLGGRGRIGKLYGQGGTISPGNSPGALTVNGNAILNAATTVRIEINGTTPGVDYDQLVNFGQLAPNHAKLQVVMDFAGAVSNQYVIVDHPSGMTSTVFFGLPTGATVTANDGTQFRITYSGGDGNDTVLTQLNVISTEPPLFTGATILSEGQIQLTGTGTPGLTYSLLANTNLNTTNWIALGPVTANAQGVFTFIDSLATNHPSRFYRLALP